MGKKHDENRDLASVSRIAKVNYGNRTISAPKGTRIGIHMWGKINYLTHYCDWFFNFTGDSIVAKPVTNDEIPKKKMKKVVKVKKVKKYE